MSTFDKAKPTASQGKPSAPGDILASRVMLACSGLLLLGAIGFVMVGLPRLMGAYIEFGLDLPAAVDALIRLPRIVPLLVPAVILAALIVKEIALKSSTTACVINAAALMAIFAGEAMIGLAMFGPLLGNE